MYLFQMLPLLLLFHLSHGAPYVPGSPGTCSLFLTWISSLVDIFDYFTGINWSEEQAKIIKAKLEYLWVKENSLDIVLGFDFNSTVHDPSNTDYLYDPELKLSSVDCNWKEDLCRVYWSSKWKVSFSKINLKWGEFCPF